MIANDKCIGNTPLHLCFYLFWQEHDGQVVIPFSGGGGVRFHVQILKSDKPIVRSTHFGRSFLYLSKYFSISVVSHELSRKGIWTMRFRMVWMISNPTPSFCPLARVSRFNRVAKLRQIISLLNVTLSALITFCKSLDRIIINTN